jgi:transposase
VRVSTAFNRLLGFAGTVVESVSFTDSAVVVGLRLRSRVLVCPCGRTSRARYDSSRRRWRHLDFGRFKVVLEAEVRRVDCRGCGQVRTEWVPWARPGARHTRDFEDMAGWLAQRMAKTSVAALMRSSWQTVHAIVGRLVGQHLDTDRLDGVYRIGVDEIAYQGRKFLTVVADHDTGRVVWVGEGRSQRALDEFYHALGEAGRARIQAVSMDMTRIYREATAASLPHARVCLDPFHLIKWAGEALDQTHLATPRTATPLIVAGVTPAKIWQKVRATLRAAAENLDEVGLAIVNQLRIRQRRLYRAWQLKEDLRALYRGVAPEHAAGHLKRWITRALRSRINAFVILARRIRRNFEGIIAAVQHGLSNSLLEGLNAGIRLIQRRAHGLASLDNLITMIYLCHGGVPARLPTET